MKCKVTIFDYIEHRDYRWLIHISFCILENQMDNQIIFEKYCKVILKQKVEKYFTKKTKLQ